MLTARDELRTPRPVAAAIGSPSGIRYRRGFAIPARAASRSTVECRSGASPNGQLPRADHPERDAVERPVGAGGEQQRAEDEDGQPAHAVEQPAREGEDAREGQHEQPGLDDVAGREEHAAPSVLRRSVFLPVVLEQAARRPVFVLRRVAATRTVERRDVLEWDEDVPVQLDVRHLVDVAVRGEHAFLVLAAEERDLDLLALVLARVVLHAGVSGSV